MKQLRQLEINIIRITANKPKKFNYFLEEEVLKPAANAYSNAKAGGMITITNEADIELRRKFIYAAYCDIYKVQTQIDVFYEIYKSTGLSNAQIEDLSNRTDFCRKLLKELLDNDKQKAKKLLKKLNKSK